MIAVQSYWGIFRAGLAALLPVLTALSLAECVSPAEPDTGRAVPEPPRPFPDATPHEDVAAMSDDGARSADQYCPPAECPGVVWPPSSTPVPQCLAFVEIAQAVGMPTTDTPRAVSITDLNHDDWPDVYVLNTDGPNQLFLNDAGEGFVESAAQYELALAGSHRAAAWDDADADGDVDLLVVGGTGSRLYHRNGETFVAGPLVDPVPGTAAAWIAGGWLLATTAGTRFYRALGDGTFVETTEVTGVWDPSEGAALAVADYDGDGHTDVFLANVTGPNRLFRNRGDGTFMSVEGATGVAGDSLTASTAAAWIMWPGDPLPSLYVANWDRANQFYRTNGDGTFTDQAEAFGLRDPGNTVVAAWTTPFGLALPSLFLGRWEQQNLLYMGDTMPFADFSIPLGMAATDQTVAAVWFDYDRDDRADLLVATTSALHVYHNISAEVSLCR